MLLFFTYHYFLYAIISYISLFLVRYYFLHNINSSTLVSHVSLFLAYHYFMYAIISRMSLFLASHYFLLFLTEGTYISTCSISSCKLLCLRIIISYGSFWFVISFHKLLFLYEDCYAYILLFIILYYFLYFIILTNSFLNMYILHTYTSFNV